MVTVGAFGAAVRRRLRLCPAQRPARRATGMTSRADVRVSSNDATLLSTRSFAIAAAMTSTSRRVAALPFREIDPDRAVGPDPLAERGQGRERLVVVGRQEHQVGVGQRVAVRDVGGPVAELGLEGRVVEPDDAPPAIPGFTPSLSSRGVVYTRSMAVSCQTCPTPVPHRRPVPADGPLLVFGPRSLTTTSAPAIPLTPLRFGPGIDLLRAVGAEPSLEPEPASDVDLERSTSPAYVEAVRRFSADPTARPAMGIGISDNPAFAGMHEAGAAVADGSLRAMAAILRGDVEHAHHPGGGLHHAMPAKAWGFCIYNDPALAIVRARAAGLRVLYVDLDIAPRRRRRGDLVRRPGRAHGLAPRERAVPVPGDRLHRRAGGGRGRRHRGQRAARAVHRGDGVAGRASGPCCRRSPRRSGRTSSSRSTAPTRTPGTRSRTCG